MTHTVWLAGLLVLNPSILASVSTAERTERSNIILIMADDIGAEAFGCYGGRTYKTPRIDALASQGVRFDNAFSQPLCSPSRVCILSGRYPFRSGVTHNAGGGSQQFLHEFKDNPWGVGDRPEITFAHLLKDAGYATAMAGKWGLAHFDHDPDHVRRCGFDRYCAWIRIHEGRMHDKYWEPTYIEDGAIHKDAADVFGPDHYSDYLIDFIKEHRDKPFLVYYPMTLVHFRLQDPAVNPVGEGEGSSVRKNDQAFNKRHGFTIANPKLYPVNVAYMDKIVGKIVKAVDDLGLRENTVIIFTSDNGTIASYQGKIGDRRVRGGKGQLTDAGTRVPFIVRWPAAVEPGRVVEDLVDFSDVLPTFAELAGTRPPDDREIDGVSFVPQLRGQRGTQRSWVFAQSMDQIRVRGERFELREDGRVLDLRRDRYAPTVVDRGALDDESNEAVAILDDAMRRFKPAAIDTYERDRDD